MTAVHLVTYVIGEVNVSYIFDFITRKGLRGNMSYKNGLLLRDSIEVALGASQVVIYSVKDSSSELKLLVLDDDIFNKMICLNLPIFTTPILNLNPTGDQGRDTYIFFV